MRCIAPRKLIRLCFFFQLACIASLLVIIARFLFSRSQPHGKLDSGFSFLAFDARPNASLTLRTNILQALTFLWSEFRPKGVHQAAVEASGGGTQVDGTLHQAAVEDGTYMWRDAIG